MSQLILNLYNKELENNLKDFAKKEFDDKICDEIALEYIIDSANYIHNLRHQGKT